MSAPTLTQADVLHCVSASRTPLGSIIDRLATRHRVQHIQIDQQKTLTIIAELIELDLVIKSEWQGETLYKKQPHAIRTLLATRVVAP